MRKRPSRMPNNVLTVEEYLCSHCGAQPYFTVNRNGYYVLMCPECGTLSGSCNTALSCVRHARNQGEINSWEDRRAHKI